MIPVTVACRPPSIKYPEAMMSKSEVSVLSVMKEDPASRKGMIEVLKSYIPFCAVNPTTGKQQSMCVLGDYGFWEMGQLE
jgi:hypothetical protein